MAGRLLKHIVRRGGGVERALRNFPGLLCRARGTGAANLVSREHYLFIAELFGESSLHCGCGVQHDELFNSFARRVRRLSGCFAPVWTLPGPRDHLTMCCRLAFRGISATTHANGVGKRLVRFAENLFPA